MVHSIHVYKLKSRLRSTLVSFFFFSFFFIIFFFDFLCLWSLLHPKRCRSQSTFTSFESSLWIPRIAPPHSGATISKRTLSQQYHREQIFSTKTFACLPTGLNILSPRLLKRYEDLVRKKEKDFDSLLNLSLCHFLKEVKSYFLSLLINTHYLFSFLLFFCSFFFSFFSIFSFFLPFSIINTYTHTQHVHRQIDKQPECWAEAQIQPTRLYFWRTLHFM